MTQTLFSLEGKKKVLPLERASEEHLWHELLTRIYLWGESSNRNPDLI